MAVQPPFRVAFEDVFPYGAVVRRVAMKRDFNASTRENVVQATDRDTGLPVWVVTVLDLDPDAIDGEVKVNVAASHQPVPPAKPDGAQFAPVELEGLRVMPYQKDVGGKQRLAYSLRADSLKDPASQTGKGTAARKEAA